ncbi:hypothetical protein BCR43DRAFT_297516 [Syncephalastrum racemosum]|uniref:F-box domain-containing protein n=1 Tax=Syncephalastrum racemosum TaxID=13706 RepID=A0A1X2H9G4_SYNRA|nr:hypothetical protein BCR43DRAFT_297516 [Syncephalastrum racemosum]
MVGFLQLPNEIIESIVTTAAVIEETKREKHLFLGWQYPEHEHNQLKSIALTCRRLYLISAPYLWRDKEFILPREDDERNHTSIPVATDILAKTTAVSAGNAFRRLGSHVRSLCRDLTSGSHYDLNNTMLMAGLVCNLRALRIDFHPKARSEHYGIRYFIESCPRLEELYLENCRDTFDDFAALIDHPRQLTSLTLLCCTIKEHTLQQLVTLLKPRLRHLLLQRVLIEPDKDIHHTTTTTMTAATLAASQVMPIPMAIYTVLLMSQNLTYLALSDTLNLPLLDIIVRGSPRLEKLAIILKETDPVRVTHCIDLLGSLSHLTILSLAFRKGHPLSTAYKRLPCCAPSTAWLRFAGHAPLLRLLHISAATLHLCPQFFTRLFASHRSLSHVMLHNILWVSDRTAENESDIMGQLQADLATAKHTVDAWEHKDEFLTFAEAERRGFDCFDATDKL